jgi:hypothetical protein
MKGLFRHAQALRLWRARGRKGGMRRPLEDSWNGSKTGTNPGEPRFVRKEGTMRKSLILTVAAVLVMATASAAPSPILDFDLTQGSGTTVVDSANGVVGTTHGTVWSTDPSGMPVLYFDNPIVYWFGDGDYFEIPYHNALNSPTMSIEALVYPMSSGYYTSIAERVRDGGTYQTITYLGLGATGYHTGRYPYFHLEIGGIGKNVQCPFEIPLNAWSHIVGTYDGNDMRLYVNGTLVATEFDVGGPRDTGSNPFYLGHAPSSNHYFNGFFAAFKLYDRALTAEEIASEFNAPPVANAGGPYSGNEGAPIAMSGASASDPDLDALTYAWGVDSAMCSFDDASLLKPNLTCSDDGSFIATLTVADGVNPAVSGDAVVTVDNIAPMAILDNNGPIDEGGSATIIFNSAYDPSSADTMAGFHYAFGCSGDPLSAATYAGSGMSDSTSCAFADNGSYPVSGKIMDKDNGASEYTTDVTVRNVAPTLDVVNVDQSLVQVNTTINASAVFTDPGTLDTHTGLWSWGDTTTSAGSFSGTGGNGTASASHGYSTPGVYTIKLTVTDKDGAPSNESVYQYVVVYDPGGGFVTGGGWFMSPEGAYKADETLTGKATSGFVAKYKKGANVPDGNTEFQFKAGDLNFHSTSYQWLVVNRAGTNAQFKGHGNINGAGNYGFMIWAGDGSPYTFRIKIWVADDETNVVYDNGVAQPIGGGSIVVHK